MRRMGIRELRNEASAAVRRAMAGERIVITISGTPAAQLGPLNQGEGVRTMDDLVAAGLVRPARRKTHGKPPVPIRLPDGSSLAEAVLSDRDE